MKLKLLAAAALVVVSLPAFAADADVRRYRQRVQAVLRQPADHRLFNHNYGPADYYPGTTAPPDRVVVPLNERPYGIYDGFDRLLRAVVGELPRPGRPRHPCY